jgi:hypothetical protein
MEVVGDIAHCAEKIYEHFNANGTTPGFVTVIVGAGASKSPKTQFLKDSLLSKSYIGVDVFETNAMAHFGKKRISAH